jgi:acetyltransferase-like isoleucine patch superfamily enzyme
MGNKIRRISVETANNSKVCAKNKQIGKNLKIGEDVIVECNDLIFGDNVNIGLLAEENFRNIGGTRIKVDRLILEDGVSIGREVLLKGGTVHLGKNVIIKSDNTINVKDKLKIGEKGAINEHCEISGRDIQIGQELWMLPYAKIGGGSAFEIHSKLRIGDYCHIGMYCFINTARPVYIGNEVGLGTRTALYTHGAYSSALNGFPIAFGEIYIGDYTWIPGATVNPGVKIGKNCIIGVNSLVTKDVPDGCLAAGTPAKVIRENAFPKELSFEERADFFDIFLETFGEICSNEHIVQHDEGARITQVTIDGIVILFKEYLREEDLNLGNKRVIFITQDANLSSPVLENINSSTTVFDLKNRFIYGLVDKISERLSNQLRRYGIRFYSRSKDKKYVKWK